MTDDKRARIERLTSDRRVFTGAELARRLARHKLPGTVEEIELGQRGQKRQTELFDNRHQTEN